MTGLYKYDLAYNDMMPPAVKTPTPPAPASSLPPVVLQPVPRAPVSAIPPAPVQVMPPAAPPAVPSNLRTPQEIAALGNANRTSSALPFKQGGGPVPIPQPAPQAVPVPQPVTPNSTTGVVEGFGKLGDVSDEFTQPRPRHAPTGVGMDASPGQGIPSELPPKAPSKPMVSGTGVVGGLTLAGENIAPGLGMIGNIASNLFSGNTMGLGNAISLGYNQAKFDEMTDEGRKQFYPNGRPQYDPAIHTIPKYNPAENNRLNEEHPILGPIIGPAVKEIGERLYQSGGLLAEPEAARLNREAEQAAELEAERKANNKEIPVQNRPAHYPIEQVNNKNDAPSNQNPDPAAGAALPTPIDEINKTLTGLEGKGAGKVEINRQSLAGYGSPDRMDARRTAEQSAVLANMTPEDAAKMRAAQLESDYNKGVINNPNSIGINVEAGDRRTVAPIFVDPSRQVGTAQFNSGTSFEPSQGKAPPMADPYGRRLMSGNGVVGPMAVGGSDVPLYETNYRDKDGNVIATITGKNQRAGGGTLSVLGGRTAEEQRAIDERVKQIDSQTDAMRGLRNANRLAQGGITVEQEEQQNAMAAMMNRLAPPPNMSGFEERQKALMSQLSAAKDIRGFGKSRQRKDAIEAAQIGLAQLANEQQALNQAHGQRQQLASQLMQNQTEQARAEQAALAAQKKAMLEQQQWQYERDFDAKQAEKDNYYKGIQANQGRQRLELDARQQGSSAQNQELASAAQRAKTADGIIKNRFTNLKGGVDRKAIADTYSIPTLPEKVTEAGVYATPTGFVAFDENGNRRTVSETELVDFFETQALRQQPR